MVTFIRLSIVHCLIQTSFCALTPSKELVLSRLIHKLDTNAISCLLKALIKLLKMTKLCRAVPWLLKTVAKSDVFPLISCFSWFSSHYIIFSHIIFSFSQIVISPYVKSEYIFFSEHSRWGSRLHSSSCPACHSAWLQCGLLIGLQPISSTTGKAPQEKLGIFCSPIPSAQRRSMEDTGCSMNIVFYGI